MFLINKMNIQDNKISRIFRLLKTAFWQYKWQVVLMAFLSFFSGILEGVGINAVIPLFSFIEGKGADDIISRAIEKFFLYFNLTFTVKYLLIFISILFIFKAIILFIAKYITNRIAADYEYNTRSELLRLMFESNWLYLSRQRVGYLEQILITDIQKSSGLLAHASGVILILTNFIIYGFLAINISSAIASLSLVVGGSIFLFLKPLFYRTRLVSGEMVRKNKELAHYAAENIIGMKAIKSISAEYLALKKGLTCFDNLKTLSIKLNLLSNFIGVLMQPIAIFFIIGIFAIFYKTSIFSFASFAVIVYAINRIFSNIQLAQSEIHNMSAYVPYLISALNYKKNALEHKEQDFGKEKFNFNKALEFKNVSFAYNDRVKALFDINFSVKKGEMVGIIGPSGSGKTTIVDLLLRLFAPKKGDIFLDEENIANINVKDWRKNVGYVSQDIFLFNDTIENNIRFYVDFINDEDIKEAAKRANIYDFIESQPDGFKTMVGERGIRLSGGQRQRIVLARALVRKPQILILDEATSALDNESEILVQKAIKELKGRITVIAIAHRLSTVIHSDKLIVLENGGITEEGIPQELLKDKESYFSKVYNLRK